MLGYMYKENFKAGEQRIGTLQNISKGTMHRNDLTGLRLQQVFNQQSLSGSRSRFITCHVYNG